MSELNVILPLLEQEAHTKQAANVMDKALSRRTDTVNRKGSGWS